MPDDSRIALRYQPQYCLFVQQEVWAIQTQHPDGGWRVVNCLDKEAGCFGLGCIFTTDQGEWPYRPSETTQAPLKEPPPSRPSESS